MEKPLRTTSDCLTVYRIEEVEVTRQSCGILGPYKHRMLKIFAHSNTGLGATQEVVLYREFEEMSRWFVGAHIWVAVEGSLEHKYPQQDPLEVACQQGGA